MQNSSASQEHLCSKTELNVFLERFSHLSEGTSVLNQGNIIEADNIELRPSEQLLSALKMIDVVFEMFDLEKVASVNSVLQIENTKIHYERMIDEERISVKKLQTQLEKMRAENDELRLTLTRGDYTSDSP